MPGFPLPNSKAAVTTWQGSLCTWGGPPGLGSHPASSRLSEGPHQPVRWGHTLRVCIPLAITALEPGMKHHFGNTELPPA